MKLFSFAIVQRATWVHMCWKRECHNSRQKKIKDTLLSFVMYWVNFQRSRYISLPQLSPLSAKDWKLNSTCVILRNPSSFVNASESVVAALRAETKQHGLWRRPVIPSGLSLSFQGLRQHHLFSAIDLSRRWSEDECYILMNFFCCCMMCDECFLSWPEGQMNYSARAVFF